MDQRPDPARKPPERRFPLSAQDLEQSRQALIAACPDVGPEGIAYGVACEVIINVFGPDRWALRITGTNPDEHFRADDTDNPFLHQSRVIEFAADLMVCQHLPGFADQREQMARRAWHAVTYEARVARMLHESGRRVEFNVPQGRRGDDFDLLVDEVLAVEVKARQDDAAYDREALSRSIRSDVRRQLPAAGPGLVVLRIPDSWGSDPQFAADTESLFVEVFRSTKRINAMVLIWDEWLTGQRTGAARLTRFAAFENPEPRTDFPDLPRLVRSITLDGSLGNDSMEIPRSCWTIACSVRRWGGPGPLIETGDRRLQIAFDRGGRLATRIDGALHRTQINVRDIDGQWIPIVLRFDGATADLRVAHHPAEAWSASASTYMGITLCPDVDADVRQHLVYSECVSDETVAHLMRYLSESTGPYVAFRRGDVPRYRTGNDTG